MLAGHLHFLFEKMSTQVFCPFLNCFVCLSCISYLYMLDINSLSVLSFENIFFHSIDCIFILLMVSFAVQKLLSLISSIVYVYFYFLYFRRTDPKRYCCDLCQRVYSLYFPLRVLWYLVLTLIKFLCLKTFSLAQSFSNLMF